MTLPKPTHVLDYLLLKEIEDLAKEEPRLMEVLGIDVEQDED